MKSKSEARPSPFFFFFLYVHFSNLQPLGSGEHEIKINELPDRAWSGGTIAANWWGSLKGYLCEWFWFLPSYIPHVSMHFEKSRRLNVLWTIWNFSMVSTETCQDHWILFTQCNKKQKDTNQTNKQKTQTQTNPSELIAGSKTLSAQTRTFSKAAIAPPYSSFFS